MLSWFQALMPREERFFDLFERHAETLVAGAHALRELLDGGESALACCQEIRRQEHDADEITREALLAVRRTFITPFDRSDIRDLITAMDDTIDQMHQTAKATLLYEIREFEAPHAPHGRHHRPVGRNSPAARFRLLRSMRQNAGRLNAFSEEITRIEDEADAHPRSGAEGAVSARIAIATPWRSSSARRSMAISKKSSTASRMSPNRVTGIVIEHT